MRHRKSGIKLNRTTSHRNAMFRNMVTSLFKYDRIKTTDAKAKELRRWADNLVTLAKRGDLHARRQAMAIIQEKNVVHRLFENAGEKYGERSGGYTRIVKLGKRPGDAADISLIELIAQESMETKKKAKPKADKKKPVEEKPQGETKPEEVKEEAAAEPTADSVEASSQPSAQAQEESGEAAETEPAQESEVEEESESESADEKTADEESEKEDKQP